MYDSVEQWRRDAKDAMYRLESKLCEIRDLQTEAAKLAEKAIQAYKWPTELPTPTNPDEYGATCSYPKIPDTDPT